LTAGAGPRHFTFHPSGRYAYVINELDATLTAFAYDAEHGSLETIQTVSTLPGGFQGDSFCADIHLTPDGRFLYGSNRGHDSIAIFAVDPATGRLTAAGHEATGGHWPRNFAVDPSGAFLLAANQRSNTIVPFRIDRETGMLTPTGHVTETPAPVCLKFA
jgi:6-phosphogluconolactonase